MNAIAINAFSGEINQQQTTLVNARDLHAYLGVETAFSRWILRRVEEFGFVRDLDFTAVAKIGNSDKWFGSREITEYHITLDMAKELCMVERSEVGRAARRYFIEMEKEHRDAVPAWAVEQWAAQQLQLKAAQEALLQGSPFAREVVRLVRMGLSGGEIGKLLDCSETTVQRTRMRLKAAGLLEGVPVLRNGNAKRGAGVGIAGQARNDSDFRNDGGQAALPLSVGACSPAFTAGV